MDIRSLLCSPEGYETKVKLEDAPYRFEEDDDVEDSPWQEATRLHVTACSGESGFA